MEKCSVCGKNALMVTNFRDVTLCKKCDSLINASSQYKRDFLSNDELMQQKNSALQLALENGFSQKIINSISEFFDEYIKDGYITTIDGKAGQKLKLFTNYCIVVTKN